ncbi:MAG: hypothetical protein ABFS28_09595 [Bacteroidota bacterium]
MDFSREHIEYRVKQIGDSSLVWLKTLNRYLQLEEPAFLVFQQFADGLIMKEIVQNFAAEYAIPEADARRFVSEIKHRFESLYREFQVPDDPGVPPPARALPFLSYSERNIKVSGKIIRFTFGDSVMEKYLFPHFAYLEFDTDQPVCDLHVEFLNHHGKVFMKVNQEQLYAWPANQIYKLKGALFMQILNEIHDEIKGEWMGVIHAASVSLGNRAVMFPARSGGGKSTLASLMMAHGCSLLSDDFTPIALNGGIHSFPGSISLKSGSLPVLESYFPELMETRESQSPSKEEAVRYLRPQQPEYPANGGFSYAELASSVQVHAIVFVQYKSQKACELERISNLTALNDFLTESWLPDDARVSEKFLDWFFEIPCYTLHYGDNLKAVELILSLLKDVT